MRYFDPVTGEELIHRDNRRLWESASALGQIIWRCGPSALTFIDIDGAIYKRSLRLLRIIEHKQPGQSLKGPQFELLHILAIAIENARMNGILHADSGVFVLRGKISAEQGGHRKTFIDGETETFQIKNGRLIPGPMLPDAEELFRWLEGTFGTATPSGPRRASNAPSPSPQPPAQKLSSA